MKEITYIPPCDASQTAPIDAAEGGMTYQEMAEYADWSEEYQRTEGQADYSEWLKKRNIEKGRE
jgi:hypothetical protein